jgi:hypothetical protein
MTPRKFVRFLLTRVWWTILALSTIIAIDVAIFVWLQIAPDTVPRFLSFILVGTILGAPIVVVLAAIESFLTSNSDAPDPILGKENWEATSDAAERALTETVRKELERE